MITILTSESVFRCFESWMETSLLRLYSLASIFKAKQILMKPDWNIWMGKLYTLNYLYLSGYTWLRRSTNSLQESLNKVWRASTSGNSGEDGAWADLAISDRRWPFDIVSCPPTLLFASDESTSSSWNVGRSSFTKLPNKASKEKLPYKKQKPWSPLHFTLRLITKLRWNIRGTTLINASPLALSNLWVWYV